MIRPLAATDEEAASRLLDVEIAGRLQGRLGEIHDVLALSGLVADLDGRLVGVAAYAVKGQRAELAAVAVDRAHRLQGIGTALVEAVVTAVTGAGATELWLVTTNDNLDALGLYQRRGFRLHELRPGAVDAMRQLKPSIPPVGQHGIPLRDELVLVRPLGRD